MIKIKSKINDKLLHLVYCSKNLNKGRTELVEESNFIQCSYLHMDKGKTFRAHQHIWKEPSFKQHIAQESWVVIQGSVEVMFHDTDGSFIESHVLYPGDASFTLEGGHNYKVLEDNTLVYEYKTGPYEGQSKDKIFLDEM